jgi:hypothetical protein
LASITIAEATGKSIFRASGRAKSTGYGCIQCAFAGCRGPWWGAVALIFAEPSALWRSFSDRVIEYLKSVFY